MHRRREPNAAGASRKWLQGRARWLLVGAVGLAGPAVLAGPAGATGPSYPGETLSVTQTGPAVAGQAVSFLATGQQTDIDNIVGGFGLDAFEKDPSVDPTCAPDYWDESNNAVTDPTELHFIIGDWEGLGQTFSVPFKAVFSKPGPVLICAYSTWITDTAASAVLTVNVTSPGSTGTTTPPSQTAKPVNTTPPHVARQHNKLTCGKGAWSNSPASFSFRWLTGHHELPGAKPSLVVSRSLRGHQVRCSVSARNSAGTTTAVSRAVWVH
jgi:hypothetical protein